MRALMGLYGLCELGHNRAKGIVLVEPMGKEMHPHKRQAGRYLHDGCIRGHRRTVWHLARAPFAPAERPCGSQSIEMADTHRHRSLRLGHPVEEDSARAGWVLLKQLPQKHHLNGAKLSPSRKEWTGTFSEGTLVWGEEHDFILLELCFRMKSAPSPL